MAVRIVQTPRQAESDARSEAEARQHDAEDLDAQVRAADAAEKQITPAWVAAFLSFAATVLLVLTVHETRNANGIAREHMATDLRAWLLPAGVGIGTIGKIELAGVDYIGGITANIRMANKGRTPALKSNMWTQLVVVAKNEPIPHFEVGEYERRSTVIAPDAPCSSSMTFIVGDDHKRFLARDAVAYIYCYVTYHTVFDNTERVSEACFRLTYVGQQQTPGSGVIHPNIDIDAVGPQNTAT